MTGAHHHLHWRVDRTSASLNSKPGYSSLLNTGVLIPATLSLSLKGITIKEIHSKDLKIKHNMKSLYLP